ncbi:MAG: M24 family metallopeptidase [Eubacteriales bacterium]
MTLENLRIFQKNIPEGMDAVLLTSEMHQFYMTGFNIQDGYVAVLRDRAFVFVDFRYIEAAQANIDTNAFTIHMNTSLQFIRDTLADAGAGYVGFEDRFVTVSMYEYLKKVFGEKLRLLPIGGLLEDQRTTKTEYELDMIKKAQSIGDAAFDHILGFITPERTETEIALELEYRMKKLGASGTSFSTICISGAATSLPHGEPQNRKIEPGFLTMDFGCIYNGYCSDMTRTVAVGKVTQEMRDVYATVLAAQNAVLEKIDWHSDCGEMDKIARDIIDGAGYKGAFGHSLGHGVGLYIHEMPRMSTGAFGNVLENGYVVTVEPGIYLAGRFGVRIEDMVIIHHNRAEDITHAPKNLILL